MSKSADEKDDLSSEDLERNDSDKCYICLGDLKGNNLAFCCAWYCSPKCWTENLKRNGKCVVCRKPYTLYQKRLQHSNTEYKNKDALIYDIISSMFITLSHR